MEIMELFDESTMNLDLQGETKDQIIEEMVTLLDEGGVLADKEAYKLSLIHISMCIRDSFASVPQCLLLRRSRQGYLYFQLFFSNPFGIISGF